MSQQILQNSTPGNDVTYGTQRTMINENFTEVYNLILGASGQVTVINITARNQVDAKIGTQVFVTNDGDGKWALYKATTAGVNATYVKLSDPDLLNAVMSNAAIKTAYESNADTNAFTNALKIAYDNAVTLSANAVPKVAGKSLLSDTEIARLLTLTNGSASMGDWVSAQYPAGTYVYHNGTVWVSNNAVLVNEEPGISSKWNPKTGVVDGKISSVVFEETDYFFVFENYSMKYVANPLSHDVMFSKDSEKTWVTWTNPYGPVVNLHVFSNGEILVCTTNRVFHTRDFVTVTQGQLFDHDGTPYTPPNYVSFFKASSYDNRPIFVDGIEMAVWSDYFNDDPNYVSRMWYTTDYGRTLKCALKYGTTLDKNGQVTSCRHAHGTSFNKYNGRFYSNTGDGGTQCKIFVSDYNTKTDTWIHERVAMGEIFKFTGFYFDSIYTYVTTDYLPGGGRKGIRKVRTEDVGDITKYEYYIVNDDLTKAIVGFAEDSNGNKILTGDWLCFGKFYYAYGSNNFQEVKHNFPGSPIAPPGGFSSNGDMYVMKQPPTSGGSPTLRNKFFNIAKAMRKAGVYNFGRNPTFHNRDFIPLLKKDITFIVEQKNNDQLKFWRGTLAEFTAIPVKDDNTIYIYPKPAP